MAACRSCKKTTQLRKCGGCINAQYCSKECQRADWPIHRSICNAGKKPTQPVPKPVRAPPPSYKHPRLPTRPTYINGVKLVHPSRNNRPTTELLLYHGIIGPFAAKDTEAFRLFVNISLSDFVLLGTTSHSTKKDRVAAYNALFRTVTPIVTGTRKWACVECGKDEGVVFVHATQFTGAQMPGMLVNCWDSILPVCVADCESKIEYENQVGKVRKLANEEDMKLAKEEMSESYGMGLEIYFKEIYGW